MVLSICACVFFRSASFLRASFACRLPSKAWTAFSKNSAVQFRSILGLMLFSAAMVLSSFSPCRTSMTSLDLYSGVYVLRVMVSSPFHFLAVFYHVHDNFSSCGLKLWDHYNILTASRADVRTSAKNQDFLPSEILIFFACWGAPQSPGIIIYDELRIRGMLMIRRSS